MNGTDLVKEWFEIASDDLRSATFLYDKLHPKPLEIICYHCHQTVEKVLKGFLTDRGIEPPYTHDLEELRLMCMQYDSSFDTIQKACVILKSYSASTRYPGRPQISE
jgi:HEPN domain-containing protein